MSKKILVAIADGIEEIETSTVVDILRRAGAEVTVASVGELQVRASRDVVLIADRLLSDCVHEIYDCIVLPGGMPGAEHLRDSEKLISMLKEQKEAGRWIAAICASPVVVLQHHNLLNGIDATSYPSMMSQLDDAHRVNEKVVIDQNIITSQGPGTAIAFALQLVAVLYDKESADQIAQILLYTIGGGNV